MFQKTNEGFMSLKCWLCLVPAFSKSAFSSFVDRAWNEWVKRGLREGKR